MEHDIWSQDRVIKVVQSLYGDKCIVWQLEVLSEPADDSDEDCAVLRGYVTETEYGVSSKSLTASSDIVTTLNADVSEVPTEVLDRLVAGLSGISRGNIIGYDE